MKNALSSGHLPAEAKKVNMSTLISKQCQSNAVVRTCIVVRWHKRKNGSAWVKFVQTSCSELFRSQMSQLTLLTKAISEVCRRDSPVTENKKVGSIIEKIQIRIQLNSVSIVTPYIR